jgi:hypothetical protein
MSESPEVESNYGNPKGKSNLEKGAEPPAQKPDNADPVQVRKSSNPKMPPSGNLENAGQSDNTKSA